MLYLDWVNTACYAFDEVPRREPARDMERDDAILNSKDVARLLDMSPDTVNEYARKSILPAFKKGRQWRFRKRDIAQFKRQLRGETAA